MTWLFANPLYLFLLIIVVGCAVGIFAWYKFGSSVSGRLKGPEKSPSWIVGKSPEVEQAKLLVDNVFFLSNDRTEEAWGYHPDALQYDKDGAPVGLLLTHDTCLPQFTNPNIDIPRMYESFKKSIRPITLAQFHKAVETEIVRNSNNALGEWLGFSALVAVGGVLVIVIFIMIKNVF